MTASADTVRRHPRGLTKSYEGSDGAGSIGAPSCSRRPRSSALRHVIGDARRTAAVACGRQVKVDLREWRLHRVIWVLDTGFSSEANRRYLQRAGGHFIVGEKLRSGHLGSAARPRRVSTAATGPAAGGHVTPG
jgi:hypothetical protein